MRHPCVASVLWSCVAVLEVRVLPVIFSQALFCSWFNISSQSAPSCGFDVATSAPARQRMGSDEAVSDEMRKLWLSFLKAAQAGMLAQVQQFVAQTPSLLHEARSTSKGYTAMHFAAMSGSLPTIQWLADQGLSTDIKSPSGVDPVQVKPKAPRTTCLRQPHLLLTPRASCPVRRPLSGST